MAYSNLVTPKLASSSLNKLIAEAIVWLARNGPRTSPVRPFSWTEASIAVFRTGVYGRCVAAPSGRLSSPNQ
jgi:hypothetical protein